MYVITCVGVWACKCDVYVMTCVSVWACRCVCTL